MHDPADTEPLEARRTARWAWRWALACFVLAAGTGTWLRFGTYLGLPAGLRFGDVRHAHSHLMFFGWVTPALIAFMAVALSRQGTRLPGLRWLLAGTFAAALLAFPAFLASGYRSTALLGRELPLSMMAAGLNGLAWIALIVAYLVATPGKAERDDGPPASSAASNAVVAWLDAAILMLAMSLLGIAGLAATGMSGLMEPRLTAGLVDFFLSLFGEGWFAAGLMGLAFARLGAEGEPAESSGLRSATDAGTRMLTGHDPALLFPAVLFAGGLATRATAGLLLSAAGAGMPRPAVLPPSAWLEAAVSLGHLATGAGLVWGVFALLRPRRPGATWLGGIWIAGLAFLAIKGIVELGLAAPGARAWVEASHLRVLLLHAFLLGAVSVGLVGAARDCFEPLSTFDHRATARWSWIFLASVVVVLGSLVPLTGLWPESARGLWSLQLAAFAGLGPVVAAVGLLAATRRAA